MNDFAGTELSLLLHYVLDRASDFFGIATPDGDAVFVNQSGKKMLAIGPKLDIKSTKMFDYVHPSDLENFRSNLVEAALETGEASATVNLRDFASGAPVPVDMRFFTVTDPDTGKIQYFMAFGRDLRDFIENQKLLKLTKRVEEVAHVGGWELDIETGRTIWTDQVYEIYGLPVGTPTDKIQGISFYAPHEQRRIAQYVDSCIKQGAPWDDLFEFYDQNKTHKWVRSTGEPIYHDDRRILRVVGTFQDVTKEKLAELELKRAHFELNQFFEKSIDLLCISDIEGNFRRLNPKFSEVLGYTPEEIFAMNIRELVHPDDFEATVAETRKLSRGEMTIDFVNRYRTKSGDYVTFEWAACADIANGMVYSAARDITKQVKSENLLKRVIANNPGAVYQFKLETNGNAFFTYISDQGFEIYERNREEYERDPSIFVKAIHPDDQASLQAGIMRSADALEKFEWEGRLLTPKGEVKWISAKSLPQKQLTGDVIWDGVLLDVTREKLIERELNEQRSLNIQSSKLAAMGELAAGVGHEINNPLAIAIGNVDRLYKEIEQSGKLSHDVTRHYSSFKDATQRIVKIVEGLRAFVRAHDQSAEVFDLKQSVTQTISLISNIFRNEGVDLRWHPPAEAFPVCGSESQIQQVIMNLLTNARDAVSAVGEKRIEVLVESVAGHVRLSVTDTGPGIEEKYRGKIFEAFFTTKSKGKGTGIGLSLSSKIIQDHGGTIVLDHHSKVTRFVVTLPIAQAPVRQAETGVVKPAPITPQQVMAALVIDDEEGIRELLTLMLQDLGCRVSSVGSGQEALTLVASSRYDLILTDLQMPGMSGVELATSIRSRNLSQGAVLAAFTGGMVEQQIVPLFDLIIKKPFLDVDIQQLVQMAAKKKQAPAF